MAFEDALIGSEDFDPRIATEALIRGQSAEPLPVTLDPRMLNTRLARKLAQPGQAPAPVEPPAAAEPAAAPDFSAQGVEPAASINTEADFSSMAAEPPVIGPTAPAAANSISLSDYPVEFGKGVLEGGKNMGAAALKGTAAVGIPSVADTGLLDELHAVKDKTPSQRAKLMGRVLREITDRGLQMDYNAALRRVSQGGDPATEIETLRPKFEANNKSATEPVTDKSLYKAGQAVEDYGKEALAPKPGFEPGKSWTRDLGAGAGSMAAGIGVSMIPGIGPAAAGALFTTAGMGEAAEKAVHNKASNDEIRRATMLGGVAGATDLVDALIPMLGSTGKVIGFLKRMGLAAVKGAVMEGGQEGVQQLMQNAIAKGIYKPDQDLMEDVPRSVAIAAILGGVGGGISGAATRDRGAAAPGIAPPPGGGAAPGTGPTTGPGGPQSSPEDIADFVRQAREGAPEQPAPEGPAPGPDPASMSEAERMRAYTASRESHGGASETDILKAAGLDPDTMDEQERIDAVIRAAKKPDAGGTADSNAAGSAPGNASASAGQETPKTEDSHLRYAVLREYGYSDEDIDNMSAGQRGREFNDAIAEGILPGKAMSKHPKRKPKTDKTDETPTSESDVEDTTGLRGMGSGMADAMGENLRSMLWDRVQAGEVKENSTSSPSALLQGAKMIRARGGLKTRAEFDAYAKDQADTDHQSPTFQQDMRALVDKHSPKGGDGSRKAPSRPATAEDVQKAQPAQPTEAQAEAENYKHAHMELPQLGLVGKRKISIETGLGQERKGVGEDGKPWSIKLTHAAYGRIGGTEAADFKADGKTRQNLDIFIGPHPTSEHVFVIDQHKPGGGFDEHKIMAGFRNPVDALHAYAHSYNDHGKDRIGHVTAMDVADFRYWLDFGDTTKALKPASTGPDKTGEAGHSAALTQEPVTSTGARKETPAAVSGARSDDRSAPIIPEPAKSSVRQPTKEPHKSVTEPLSLLQFIASKGGLAPHAELDALDIGDRRVQIPGRKGFFGIIRPTGMSLDNMREAAEEADYLKGEHNKTSTIRNLLDAMDVELRGGDHRAAGEEGKTTKKQRTSAAESSTAARDKAITENVEAIRAEYTELPEGLAEQAATIMADELLDLDSAVEMAAVRAVNEDADYQIEPNDITATYGEGAFDAIQTRSASADGGIAPSAGDQEQQSDQGEEASRDGEPDARAGAEGGEDQGEVTPPLDGLGPVEAYRAIHAEADRRYPPTESKPDKKGKTEKYVSHEHIAFANGAQGYEWDMAMPIHIKRADVIDDYLAGVRWKNGFPDDPAEMEVEPSRLEKTIARSRAAADKINAREAAREKEAFARLEAEQASIPGTEPIGQGEQAQRAADKPLKPTKPQKPADDGLFGDTMDQADLLDQIEKTLGTDADKVAPVDIARAAEIMADNPGMLPEIAFGQAVIVNAVEQGFITEQQAEESYGLEVKAVLDAERAGAPVSGSDDGIAGAQPAEDERDNAAQAGELPSGSEAGREGGADTAAQDFQFDDAGRVEPDTRSEAGGVTVEQGASATENPNQSVAWTDLPDDMQDMIEQLAPARFEAGTIPKTFPVVSVKVADLPAIPLVEDDRGSDYAREMDLAKVPPILIAYGQFVDGKHRVFKAREDGARTLPAIDLTGIADRDTIEANGMGLVGVQKQPIIKAGGDRGIHPPVHAGDAPASPEDVQPAQPGGQDGGVRSGEGSGGAQAVPRTDRKRPEGSRRVSEGAGGERSDRTGDGGDARLSEARTDDAADGRAKRAAERAADAVGDNFVIEPGALDESRGQKTKARDNIKAIAAMQLIEMEGRPATAAEQADLARYVGWGGIKNIFPDESGNYGTGFEELGAKLRGLLSDEEYTTARRSIQYAHYTAEDVVRSMWDAVAKMGFTGGQVFEPGMGIGNFAGMMPADIAANSHYQGVELDHVTARIAKLLYPKYGVRQDDFTKTRLPENSYDLVIGNPPFADVAIKSDPKYKQGFLLHDYFFAKSLDAVRPGGLLAFVTSAGTMNKLDMAARDYLADRADLVGAIRLPGDAFKKNAGTEVTTDIIFLRKRLPGDIAGDRSWTATAPVALPGKDGDVTVNVGSYFLANPQMVLGRQDANDRLYPGRYSVKSLPGADLKADLATAIDNLPADVMSPWQDVNAESVQHDFDTTEKKEGTYYVGPDGSLHQVTNGVGQKVGQRGKGVENGRTAADMERIKGLIPVRDALRAVYAADLKGDTANATRARQALNKTYDDFSAKFGPINKAVIQTRRPNVIQMEAARDEAREEARYAGERFREGDFDASSLIEAKTPLSVIARKRQETRDDAASKGLTFDEGNFDLDEVPDVIIDKRPNVDPFMDDPESYRLRAIERYDEGTGTGHKSDVFFKNIITREVTPKINSVNDGLLYSLSQYGRVNIPAIAELTKKTDAEVIAALGEQVFKVPGTKDTFQTRDEYLSGNVRKKLEQAQRAADRNPEFRRNVAALEANQPTPLAPSQIHASLGMPWIPPATIEQFAKQELGLDVIKVRYTPALASWTVSGDVDTVAARSTWGTEDRRAPALMQDALNRQTTKIYDTVYVDGKKTQSLNVAKTEAANDKLTQMREKFAGWIWTDQTRADTLAAYYNENYNNLVVREYNGDYLTTPGITAEWSWRPHQTRVIARIIQSGNTYVAHAVGAGKTSEYIGAIMEMRRLGLVRKPMVAVPNHMLAQFTKEWYHQYPTARLAIADDKRFHNDRRKQFIANVAIDDLDAIIITHSSFGMIPVSDAFQNSIVNREITQYREVLADLKNQGGDTRITRSRIEKQIERLEQRLVSRKGRKDATFTFEEMGVDHLTIDEAHLFRKLDFSTAMSNLKGVSPEGSQMAWDLYVKSLYLDGIRPGRGLVMGSGTPITNTMAELYTLSRYMQPQVLAERGLEKFDAWAGAFGESVSELEQDAAGNYKPVSRFAKFVNVAELSAMARQVMDVVTGKQLEQYVPRPQLKGGKRQFHLAEKTPEQARFLEGLARRMVAIQKRKGPPQKGDDIMLSVINDGRHASIDLRLAGGVASSQPSKLDLMVDNVYRIWEESKRAKFHKIGADGKYEAKPAMSGPAAQLVFVNLGLSGARGFSVPDYIRAELTRRGVPKNEVAYIYDYKSATAKQRLFNDMNEGKVRILIGSVAKMGVGTNVQKRLIATHNMDPLWYPADDEQRVGRIIRQGNMNPEVQVHDYSTKGTYDSTMWGMMEKKARFIQGFFEGDPSLRDMEDLGEASQYEQAKALTTNDPRLIRFTELKQELERANRRKTAFDSDVYNTRQLRQKSAAQIEHYTQRVEDTKKDIAQRVDTRGDAFSGKVGKETFDKRADFGVALFDRLGKLEESGSLAGAIKVATVGGFDIYATIKKSNLIKDQTNTDVFMALNGGATREVSYEMSSLGTVRSIEHILNGFEHDLDEYKQRLDRATKFVKDSEAKASAKFAGQAEIDALAKQVRDLADELAAKPADAPGASPSDVELADLSDMGATLTPAADDAIDSISRMLTSIVRSIAGDIPEVKFHKGLIPLKTTHGYPAGMEPKAAGLYNLGTSLLQLALTRNAEQMAASAFHESYHHIEDKLQTPAERELMKAETPRLRAYIKGKTRLTDEQVDGLAGYEVRAIAFQTYAADRVEGKIRPGIHIGVRRWFDRLMDLLAKIRNGLKGLGFTSYQDVFNTAYTGGFAGREQQETNGIDPVDLAALHDVVSAVTDRVASVADWTELRVQIQDKFIRVRHAQDSVGGVPTAQDAYQAQELSQGRTGEQLERLEENEFDPLIKDMKARGISLPEIGDYLYAKHAPEANREMDAINHPNFTGTGGRDLRGRGSGMSNDEAQVIMDGITAAGRMHDFEAVERRVRKIIDDTRQHLIDAGLLSQETADAWAAQYDFYVPLRGFAEGAAEEALFGRGMGYDTRAKESKQRFGRLSRADNPLAYTMMQAELAIVRGEKNKVGNTLLRFVRSNPNPARWDIDTPKLKKAIDDRTGLVTMVEDRNWYNDPNIFVTKVGGRPVLIHLKGTEGANLARAMKNMGTSNMNAVLKLFNTATTFMARLATQYNPNFLLTNLARDVGEAFINLQAQDQQRFIQHFSKHLLPAIKGSFQALRGTGTGRYADAFREFDKAGGRIRFFGLDNPTDIQANVAKKLRRLEGGAVNNLIAAGEAAAHAMEVVNGSIENATRLAAYMAARDVGMSIPDSASLAINMTVNFTRRGELNFISSLYMFANASIQGTVRVAQAMTHKKVRRAAYGLVAFGALAAMFSAMAGGDDDDGTSYYTKIKPYIRDKHLIIMWPKGMGHDGQYLKIPLPYAFSPFFVLGSRLATVFMGKDKPADAALAVLNSIAEAMNPLGEEGGMPFHPLSIVPSVFRPSAHIATNQNWTGNKLYPTNDYEKNKPDSEQSFRSNSTFSKAAAREINKLGGGSPYKSSGWLDWHPASIDHTLESLTGGLGKFVMDVVRTGGAIYNGDPFDATKAPIIKRFVGSAKDPQTDAAAYYEQREEARKNGGDAIKNARKDRASGVNKEDAESFLRSNTNSLAGEQVFKNADAAMKPLRDQRTRIEANTEMNRDAKRTAIEDVTEKMRQIQNRARKQYQELKQGASP